MYNFFSFEIFHYCYDIFSLVFLANYKNDLPLPKTRLFIFTEIQKNKNHSQRIPCTICIYIYIYVNEKFIMEENTKSAAQLHRSNEIQFDMLSYFAKNYVQVQASRRNNKQRGKSRDQFHHASVSCLLW
jgi:hypothetical protein